MNKVTHSIIQARRTRQDESVQEKYRILKAILERKYGRHSGLLKAVIDYENMKPTGFLPPSHDALEREIQAEKAQEDPDVLAAASNLLNSTRSVPPPSFPMGGKATPNSNISLGRGRWRPRPPSKAEIENRRLSRLGQQPKNDKKKGDK